MVYAKERRQGIRVLTLRVEGVVVSELRARTRIVVRVQLVVRDQFVASTIQREGVDSRGWAIEGRRRFVEVF